MWTKAFWTALADRAVRSLAQGLLAGGIVGVGILDVDWQPVLSLAGSYALVSALTSIASGAVLSGRIGAGETLDSAVAADKPDLAGPTVAGEASDLPVDTPVDVVPSEDPDAAPG